MGEVTNQRLGDAVTEVVGARASAYIGEGQNRDRIGREIHGTDIRGFAIADCGDARTGVATPEMDDESRSKEQRHEPGQDSG
jgi:hypothetical protein